MWDTQLAYVPSTSIYLENTPWMHMFTQAHAELSFLCASTVSCHPLTLVLLKKSSTQCIYSGEVLRAGQLSPLAQELCPLKLGGKLVAAKHGFLSRGSGHKNLVSLGKYPQFSCGPQSDFVSLILVLQLEWGFWSEIYYTRKHFSWLEKPVRFFPLCQFTTQIINFFSITTDTLGNTWRKAGPRRY